MSFGEWESKEIEKIREVLGPGEVVLLVATQSRLAPGGSLLTPNTIFATNQRIIIRNPEMLGLRAGIEDYSYRSITGIKVEKGLITSHIYITIPGLGGERRLVRWRGYEEAELTAIPHDKARKLQRIISDGIRGALPGQEQRPYPAPTPVVTPLAAPSMSCPKCGKAISPDFKVCPYCAAPIEKMFCPRCGKEIQPTFAVCPYCGGKIGEQQESLRGRGEPLPAS